MKDKLGLLVCRNFANEFRESLKVLGRTDIRLQTYISDCAAPKQDSMSFEKAREMLLTKVDQFKVLAPQSCLPCQKDNHLCSNWNQASCTNFFVSSLFIADQTKLGAYITTPGWLFDWERMVKKVWGFNSETAKLFLMETIQEVLVIDTLVYPEYHDHLISFSQFIGVPYRIERIGLEFFQLKLERFLSNWETELKNLEETQIRKRNQLILANNAMFFDLMSRIAIGNKEQKILGDTEDVLQMVFAPKAIHILRILDTGELDLLHQVHANQSPEAMAQSFDFKGAIEEADADSLKIKIGHNNRDLVYILIEKLSFPEHKDSYKRLLQVIVDALGLFIAKARQSDSLIDINFKLAEKDGLLSKHNQDLLLLNDQIKVKNEALAEAITKAEEAIKVKDKFFSILAHDLRGPFNGMKGFTQLVIDEYDSISDAEKKEYLGIVNDSLESTFKLLNDLLDWSRSQRGQISFQAELIPLMPLIQQLAQELKPNLKAKDLSLKFDLAPSTYVFADEKMLITCLRNLISNAIKFSYHGKDIMLAATLDPNTGALLISVQDHGQGIAESRTASLFNVAEMKSTTGTNGETGTGLGLLLCKEFMNCHQGQIEVQSIEGQGSTFRLVFPPRP